MQFQITIDIFSGRKNPVLEIKGKEADRIYERLKPAARLSASDLMPIPTSSLGYRGLLIEASGARSLPKTFRLAHGDLVSPRLSHRASDEDIESLIARHPALTRKMGKKFPTFLLEEIERFRQTRKKHKHHPPHWPHREHCRCAPLYEPAWWNDAGQKQYGNNCYNYSTNYRTDTFAQPGQAAGAEYTALTCASVRPAAVADDLIDSPSANNKCPKEGHLVALVIAPGYDFHWYRKGRNGYWTHKPGGTPATHVDNSGHLQSPIREPPIAVPTPTSVHLWWRCMATSKSLESWMAGALLYSGRRNPTWPVSEAVVRKLQKLWDNLPPQPKPRPEPPGLGYRGAFLQGPGNRQWTAFDGVVSLRVGKQFEARTDAVGEFESTLLASAPPGLLPPKLVRNH